MTTITMIEPEALTLEETRASNPIALQPQQPAQLATTSPTHPDNLLAYALQNGASMEQLEKLMALKERHEANEARKAYTDDMARAKQNPPTIIKDKTVGYESKDGSQVVGYRHATLGNVVKEIVAWLASYGFSHAWQTVQMDGGRVAVTCTLTHAKGHSESVTLDSAKDDSGKKNNIQALGSAITYLQRYTLLAITGLATEDQDDDGKSTGVAAVEAETKATIAAQILDNLLADLEACDSDEKAASLWASGSKSLHAAGSVECYDTFKKSVVSHRNLLKSKVRA